MLNNPDRLTLESKYNNTRINLLLVVAFTLINSILLVTNSDTYFLFSAYVPYMIISFGMYICGKYPAEYYGAEFEGAEFFGSTIFALILAVAFFILVIYFICWIFSKKTRYGWLIFALVLFSLDTLVMFAFVGLALDCIVDYLFHAWVIVSLSIGISNALKLKRMPETEEVAQEPETEESAEESVQQPLREADPYVKARVLIEGEAFGHSIVYRRVKKVNELVVDGFVYDEYEALIETVHCLLAHVDGHIIEAGFDGKVHSYIEVDDQVIARKLRLY